jgi:hypothetical protein
MDGPTGRPTLDIRCDCGNVLDKHRMDEGTSGMRCDQCGRVYTMTVGEPGIPWGFLFFCLFPYGLVALGVIKYFFG